MMMQDMKITLYSNNPFIQPFISDLKLIFCQKVSVVDCPTQNQKSVYRMETDAVDPYLLMRKDEVMKLK